MIEKGQYVQLKDASHTRRGTIGGSRMVGRLVQYLFCPDPRFHDAFPVSWVFEHEVEPCIRPTDAEAEEINRRVKRGSLGSGVADL